MIGQATLSPQTSGLGSRMADSIKKKQQLQSLSQRLGYRVQSGAIFPITHFVQAIGGEETQALLKAGVIKNDGGNMFQIV